MRDCRELEKWRFSSPAVVKHYGQDFRFDPRGGLFTIQSPTDASPLGIVASNADGWDHVSVSHRKRIPNWLEMQHVHRIFFLPHEVAMQLHVPEVDHIDINPRTLHLWRPHEGAIPLPPKEFV